MTCRSISALFKGMFFSCLPAGFLKYVLSDNALLKECIEAFYKNKCNTILLKAYYFQPFSFCVKEACMLSYGCVRCSIIDKTKMKNIFILSCID